MYGAHSLRHGFATYAALQGVEERLIMKQTRHRSVEMVRRYINEADLFTNNPIDKILTSQSDTPVLNTQLEYTNRYSFK